jgi:hypothetical protein
MAPSATIQAEERIAFMPGGRWGIREALWGSVSHMVSSDVHLGRSRRCGNGRGRGFSTPLAVVSSILGLAGFSGAIVAVVAPGSLARREFSFALTQQEPPRASSLASGPEAPSFNLADAPEALVQPNAPLPIASSLAPLSTPLESPETVTAAKGGGSAEPPPSPASSVPKIVHGIPLPVPRPAELTFPKAPTRAGAGPRTALRTAVPAPEAENRSFFQRVFGLQPSPGPSLAYAAIERGSISGAPAARAGGSPVTGAEPGTAVYDISARSVLMPNGERLEAHSGLGEKLDDPRYVHVRMSGATPPGTYELTERGQLFHGVRALRLNPVGGSAAVYGRAGLLAHTFLLGPNGDSNGCVSFKDYDKFLQAYLKGQVRRLVVVSGTAQDWWPNITRRFSMPDPRRDPAARDG